VYRRQKEWGEYASTSSRRTIRMRLHPLLCIQLEAYYSLPALASYGHLINEMIITHPFYSFTYNTLPHDPPVL
jgi:hypothetical protein